jgi:hypothetical protein
LFFFSFVVRWVNEYAAAIVMLRCLIAFTDIRLLCCSMFSGYVPTLPYIVQL